mmetsp:Transcript_33599/g.89051  ORF Transcript_33599/g.89051 Transcript_33599/m.89051 type:complete len:252 (-) Transcript_33599:327-1082(-)
MLLHAEDELLGAQSLQEEHDLEEVHLVQLVVALRQRTLIRHFEGYPGLPSIHVVRDVLAHVRTMVRGVVLDSVDEVPHLLGEELGVGVLRPLGHVEQADAAQEQGPLLRVDLLLLPLERRRNEEGEGQLVVLKETAADVHKDVLEDAELQVAHPDVDVLAMLGEVDALVEQADKVEQGELVHRVDVREVGDHEVQDAAGGGDLRVLGAGGLDLLGGQLGLLHADVHGRRRLLGLAQGADEHLVVEDVARGL